MQSQLQLKGRQSRKDLVQELTQEPESKASSEGKADNVQR